MDGTNVKKQKKSEIRKRQKQTKVRWLDDEFNDAAANARQAGLSLGAYIRSATTGKAGQRAQKALPVEAGLIRQFLGTIGRYDNNWNQVAYRLNRNEAPSKLQDEIAEELHRLRELINLGLEALGKKPHRA